MEVSFLLKTAGVGLLTAISCLVLSRAGREEQATMLSLAGIVVVLLMLMTQLSALIGTVRSVFGF